MLKPVRLSKEFYLIAGLIAFYCIAVLVNLGCLPLDGEEPRRAVVSIEMLHSGNFIRPTVFGWEYFNKPAVFNWFTSFIMWIVGSSHEWAVRLPSLLIVIVWTFTQYFFAKRFFPKPIAALSAFFLATAFDLFFYALSHGGEIDIFYGFIAYLQVAGIIYFGYQKKWLQLFAWSYFFCAIGFLTKGFSSPLFQALTLIAFCFYQRSARFLFTWQHLAGILIFSGIVGGYLWWYSLYASPQRLLVNLLNEAFKKSAVGEQSEKLFKKIFTYPISFLKLLLPWGLLLLLLLKKHRFKIFDNPLTRFSILFIAFNIWVYWFTGRPIMRYVYMFLPFCFSILAYVYWKFTEEFPGLLNKILRQFVSLFVLAAIAVMVLPFFKRVNIIAVISLLLLLSLFVFLYIKSKNRLVWLFGAGLILLRLVYAWLVIPLQSDLINPNYKKEILKMVTAANAQPITYWTRPGKMEVSVDLKIKKWTLESVPSPPVIFCQVPYYYHKYTGEIMLYDTTRKMGNTYFSYRRELLGNENITWDWFDKRQGLEFVLFRQQ